MGALRLGFVEGTTPDKWARRWRQAGRPALELVPLALDEVAAALGDGRVDVALTRLDGRLGGAPTDRERCHEVYLYDDLAVVVVREDHVATAVDEVELADLADDVQHTVPLATPKAAVEAVATQGGVAVMPMSLARRHHRRDVAHRPVTDAPASPVGLVWLRERDSDDVQDLVGVTKGRTPRSSR